VTKRVLVTAKESSSLHCPIENALDSQSEKSASGGQELVAHEKEDSIEDGHPGRVKLLVRRHSNEPFSEATASSGGEAGASLYGLFILPRTS
jgi:hypothetical protein